LNISVTYFLTWIITSVTSWQPCLNSPSY